MAIPSLLRRSEHKFLSRLVLDGAILDLGGEARSAYRPLLGGTHTYTTLNINRDVEPEILHDVEKPLPLGDAAYDHVLLINLLEHVFNYEQLLRESIRTLKPGGSLVMVVPFLFPVHPSPQDFWRFTDAALRQALEKCGAKDISIEALGGGVFAARYLLLERLLPSPVRFVFYFSVRYVAQILDWLFIAFARASGRKYTPQEYALGYGIVARK